MGKKENSCSKQADKHSSAFICRKVNIAKRQENQVGINFFS